MMKEKSDQSGFALFMSLVVLLLLSALAVAFVYMANTDIRVNANHRSQQVLYFAAKAGMEEARDRLMAANANTVKQPTCAPASSCLPAVPAEPTAGNQQILYMLGGSNPAAVTPWVIGSIYGDDELCHDGYTLLGMTPKSGDLHCVDVPGGAGWYATTTSKIPWNSTAAALPFQWVRISPKLNGSIDNGKYKVDPAKPLNSQVCWDGTQEFVLDGAPDCTQVVTKVPPGPPANPVYLITALAVNFQSTSRKMVQAEVALTPNPPFPYGLFATGTGCAALQLGGGATTDSFTSAGGQTYATSATNTGGDVGANGNVLLNGNSTQIGGAVGVPNATTGACPAGLTTVGGAGFLPPTTVNKLQAAGPYTFPTPPPPNPMPPTTDLNLTKNGGNLVPGTYGNITQTAGGTLTLAPGTYNINSLTLLGNATLVISPDGSITINVAGQGTATPVDLSGGSVSNLSQIANNFLINYGGTGTIKLSGGAQTYITVNAPNADIKVTGGSDLYGSVIGKTITDLGGTHYHYDKNSKLGPPSNNSYSEIAFREISY
jgi:hypothetical protein